MANKRGTVSCSEYFRAANRLSFALAVNCTKCCAGDYCDKLTPRKPSLALQCPPAPKSDDTNDSAETLYFLQAVDPSGEGSVTRVLFLHSARFLASSTLSCRSSMLCLTTSIHLFLCLPLLRLNDSAETTGRKSLSAERAMHVTSL